MAESSGIGQAWKLAFSRHGWNAPDRVDGDFAVAVRLDDGTTWLAVDRFAVRTLCYRIDGAEIRSAERADALGSASRISAQAIFDYLYFHAIPSPETVYADVHRVPPAHCVRFDGRAEVRPYWNPCFEESARPDFAALRDRFLALLESAVARHAREDTGCFLSGGTDSSTVAGMLGKVTGKAPRTFSIGFDAEGYDEMAFSRIAARHFGADHHEYYITPDDLVEGIPKVAASYDQPFGNSSVLPAYYCARMARDAGISRLLGGDGGDELFGGNTRYAKQRVFGLYDAVPAALRRNALEPILGPASPLAKIPPTSKIASYIRQASVPMPDRMQTYNLIIRLGPSQVLTKGLLEQANQSAPVAHQQGVWARSDGDSLVNRMLAFDWRYTLGEIDLPKVVGATRLAGLPVDFPMLDDDLLRFSLTLPTRYKLKGLKLRWFFKEALRGFLPDDIITKKKQGFGLPFGHWAVQNDRLFRLANESIESLAERGIVRPDFVRGLMQKHLREHPGYYGEMVWILMMFEQWMRAHAPDYRCT